MARRRARIVRRLLRQIQISFEFGDPRAKRLALPRRRGDRLRLRQNQAHGRGYAYGLVGLTPGTRIAWKTKVGGNISETPRGIDHVSNEGFYFNDTRYLVMASTTF